MLKKDVPDGKIVESLLTTQPLEMLPGFSVPNPGIVFLTAGFLFPGAFDSDRLKIVHEYLTVMTHEGFNRAGFSEIRVCPVCCPVFW